MQSIAFITSQAFSVHNFRGRLIRDMVDKGLTVYALAPCYDESSRQSVLKLGAIPIEYSLSRTGLNPFRDLTDTYQLYKLLCTLNSDAVFCYFIKPVIFGTLAAYFAKVPFKVAMIEGAGYVFVRSSVLFSSSWFLRKLVEMLYTCALNLSHRVFFLNNDDRDLFVGSMVKENKAVVLNGIGVPLEYFKPCFVVPMTLTFIMVARLLKEKGVYEFMESARCIKTIHPTVRFILLGTLDLNPSSITPSELNLWQDEGVVELIGHVDDVRSWLAQASVFVLPSYREGLPRSTQEAMAMGLPIITTDAVGCRETVDEGVNGFKVPVGDVDALVNAMLRFVDSPSLIPSMGAASRAMAEEKFDVTKINQVILAELGIV